MLARTDAGGARQQVGDDGDDARSPTGHCSKRPACANGMPHHHPGRHTTKDYRRHHQLPPPTTTTNNNHRHHPSVPLLVTEMSTSECW